jgi:hypothetical protein
MPLRDNGTEIEWDGDSILGPDTADELTAALMDALQSAQFLLRGGGLSKIWAVENRKRTHNKLKRYMKPEKLRSESQTAMNGSTYGITEADAVVLVGPKKTL